MTRRLTLLASVVALAFVLVACGSDDSPQVSSDTTTTVATTGFPVTVRGTAIAERPERIVTLTASATESLYAIGAGKQVVATDKYSDYPAGTPMTDLSALHPNVEAIAGYDPDLVVVAKDSDGIVGALGKLKIPVVLLPAAVGIDDVYTQIDELGKATGHVDEATALVDDLRTEIDALVKKTGDAGKGLTYYYELSPDHYSVTSKTFIGQVVGLLGLTNIADKAEAAGSSAYPQLSGEYIVQQNPDLILLADTTCCKQTAAEVGARDGWSGLRAVADGAVVELDDGMASRWGPRIVVLLDAVSAAVGKVAASR